MRPSWSVPTRLTDFGACKETSSVRINLQNLRVRIIFLCGSSFVWLSQGYKGGRWQNREWQPWFARGECRNKQPAAIVGRCLNLCLFWSQSKRGRGCESTTGGSSARVWLEAELGFYFPPGLAHLWKSPSIISSLWLLYPLLIHPPSLSEHWGQLKCIFLPAHEHNLNFEWHITCLHVVLANLIHPMNSCPSFCSIY